MKRILTLLLSLMLALSLAACGASPSPTASPPADEPVPVFESAPEPTPEPMPAGPEGSWRLAETSNSAYAPGSLMLMLGEEGEGFLAAIQTEGNLVFREYTQILWSADAIVMDDAAGVYLQDGDKLLFTYEGESYSFLRSGGVEPSLPLPPGIYQGVMFYEEGEECSFDSPFVLEVSAGGTGKWTSHGEDLDMTWSRYFFDVYGKSYFYLYDGETLTIYDGEYIILLRAA